MLTQKRNILRLNMANELSINDLFSSNSRYYSCIHMLALAFKT